MRSPPGLTKTPSSSATSGDAIFPASAGMITGDRVRRSLSYAESKLVNILSSPFWAASRRGPGIMGAGVSSPPRSPTNYTPSGSYCSTGGGSPRRKSTQDP